MKTYTKDTTFVGVSELRTKFDEIIKELQGELDPPADLRWIDTKTGCGNYTKSNFYKKAA